jgi:hypothetical protein
VGDIVVEVKEQPGGEIDSRDLAQLLPRLLIDSAV